MATHSSSLAWKIPWMVEPGGLPSVRSHRVRHDWSNWAYRLLFDYCHAIFQRTVPQMFMFIMASNRIHLVDSNHCVVSCFLNFRYLDTTSTSPVLLASIPCLHHYDLTFFIIDSFSFNLNNINNKLIFVWLNGFDMLIAFPPNKVLIKKKASRHHLKSLPY